MGILLPPVLAVLAGLPAALSLPSRRGPGTLSADLLSLQSRAVGKAPDVWLFAHLLEKLIGGAPDLGIWNAAYALVSRATAPPTSAVGGGTGLSNGVS